jgi:hypothetical protein
MVENMCCLKTSWARAHNLLKHVLGRALESQRTKGDCREAMKTIFNEGNKMYTPAKKQ